MKFYWRRKYDEDNFLKSFHVAKLNRDNKYIFKVKDKKIIAIKYNGNISIFQNECPHRNLTLDSSRISNGFMICNHHNWKFELEAGQNEKNPNSSLIKIPFKIIDNYVWIKF